MGSRTCARYLLLPGPLRPQSAVTALPLAALSMSASFARVRSACAFARATRLCPPPGAQATAARRAADALQAQVHSLQQQLQRGAAEAAGARQELGMLQRSQPQQDGTAEVVQGLHAEVRAARPSAARCRRRAAV